MDDDSVCPEIENSTDCLRRSLLDIIDAQGRQDNRQFNWDPISFVFNVPISILAAFFGLFTIFQALAAAGRGRRKSNWRAIGSWSKETTRKWTWQEMSFQFTAATPVLRTDTMLDKFEQPNLYRDKYILSSEPSAAT